MSSQPKRRDADLIILGGGCAGLSLATHLADARTALRVIVVEPRTEYHEDRTWCGWRLAPHAFTDCAIASWNSWQIATPASVIERGSKHYPYEMIRSDLFYEKACRAIDRHPSMSLLEGLAAANLNETVSHVEVALSDGSTLSAPWVIDTRPVQPALARPWLWQNFVGFVVDLDAPNADLDAPNADLDAPNVDLDALNAEPEAPDAPNVEPDALAGARYTRSPMLMDFQPPGKCVAQFMYILPMGDREFLCEWTQFAPVPGQLEEIELSLRKWLRTHAGTGWTIRRREQGSLSMALAPPVSTGRIVPAGTRGGSMRASTGYAFHAIQRWAAACSASLQSTGIPLAPQRNRLLESMDAIFLEALHHPSTSAMEIFRGLFKNSPPDSLVRFLAGMPRRSDLWPIMRGLPWATFLRAAPSALRAQMRVQMRVQTRAQISAQTRPQGNLPVDPPNGSSAHSRSRT